MAVDKLVDSTQLDADLTSVADAIRTKGGTSAQLVFPAGFVNAIDAIETGGADPNENLVKANNNTITSFSDDTITTLRSYIFYQCTALQSVVIPNAIRINANAINGCSALNNLVAPNTRLALDIKATALQTLHVPKADVGGIQNNASLATAVIGGASTSYNSNMSGNASLQVVDYQGHSTTAVRTSCFSSCAALDTLIIRKSSVENLVNVNAFTGTPFASDGSGGTLYVPSALISSYEAATNWSTILGYTNNQILPIEGSIYETQYADGTPIS